MRGERNGQVSNKTVGRWLLLGVFAVAVGIVLRVTRMAGTLLAPLQEGVTSAMEWVSERVDLGGYRARCDALQAEVDALRLQLTEQEDAVHTAAFYRQFLALKEVRPSLDLCEARVIAAERDSFTLNVGTVDGIAGGESVITAAGLVGVVAEAGFNWARVYPLSHEAVTVSVICTRTGETAEMHGGAVRLSRDSEAVAGDRVMTSGYGGSVPRGLLIGELETVTTDSGGLVQAAAVRFYAEREAHVMVVTAF